MIQHVNFSAAPAGYLEQFLPADYLPPYGTDLTSQAFTAIEGQHVCVSIATVQGTQEEYTLSVAPTCETDGGQTATCRDVDGQPVTYVDPYTLRKAESARVEAWYDFLLAKDAAARREAAQGDAIWHQNDVEGQLYRLQRDLVAFGEESTHTANFAHPGEFLDWINQVVEASPASFVVGAIGNIEQFRKATDEVLKCMHFGKDSAGKIYTRPISDSLNPPVGRPASLHDLGDEVPCEIDFDFVMDGNEYESFHGDFVTLYSMVTETLTASEERPDWYFISPGSLNVVLPVPSDGAVVTVRHDGDGSKVRVDLACEAHAARQNRLEETHQRRWGRWLDENVALSDEELEAGVVTVELALDALRVREATGEVTHASAH